MSKYPFVYLLRKEKYNNIDSFFSENIEKLNCTIEIISPEQINKLKNMFDVNYHLLVTYGDSEEEYLFLVWQEIVDRMTDRWIHKKKIDSIDEFNSNVNYCYINFLISSREKSRPKFSIFTTCYNSYDKIFRAYDSLKTQKLKDWEWVIIDDSGDDKHFTFLKTLSSKDKRIRLYNRDGNSGNIGNVKNEAVSLCRGKYVLELDHDDIILPDLLKDAYIVFEKDTEIGFVYADFANVYENWNNFKYNDFVGKGYGCYYRQKINNKWLFVYSCPGINNVTSSHLVCLPNHPRMWRREILLKLGNYSEFLPICDDFEILLRTVCNTKIAKIHKLGYIQFMNDNNNNFSLIRNKEINRLGPYHIQPQFYRKYNVNKVMKEKNAWEDEKYIYVGSKIWERENFNHKVCNITINLDYDKQYCLLGVECLDYIDELYKNPRNDFILLENEYNDDYIISLIEDKKYDRIKFYSLKNSSSKKELERYFKLICKYTENYEIIRNFNSRHSIINYFLKKDASYLEIGVETGWTFNSINTENKIGVDPDPLFEDKRLILKTSDDFFTENKKTFDIIFIDGMHHYDFVYRDFINSLKILNDNGIIFLDDVLPLNKREQLRIPIKHRYEKGILKYGEPWTGDVWKFAYYLIKNCNEFIDYELFTNKNFRGVLKIKASKLLNFSPETLNEIKKYDYDKDFNNYFLLLQSSYKKKFEN